MKSVEPMAAATATAPTQSLEGVSSPEDSASTGWSSKPSRTLRLRDAVWVREAMDDLVAAEFALRLDLADNTTEDRVSAAEAMQLSSVSGPDFERLREQLDRRCDELAASAGATVTSAAQREVLGSRMRRTALALDDAARRDASKRARIRELLSEGRNEQRGPSNETLGRRLVLWASDVWFDLVRRGDAVAELGRLAVRSTTGENRTAVLYVRGDGSVDWEGALQGARAATVFSRDLWRRINGVGDRHDGDDDEDGLPRSSDESARLSSSGNGWRRTETMVRLRAASDAALAVARARRQLSELVSTPDLQRSRYRAGEAELRASEARMSLADLDLALERACAVLERDVHRTETDLDRTMLAEFALLDAQVVSLCRDAQYSPGPAILEPELNILSRQVADFVARVGVASRDDLESCDEAETLLEARQAVVDAELAAVASKDDNFFFAPIQQPRKARVVAADDDEESSLAFFPRLWMSSQAESSRRQRLLLILGGALGDKDIVNPAARLLTNLDKLKAQAARGLAFYADGSKLLAADVAFCVSLVGRAFNGETLSQRDVRVLRRTLKDIATTIPFVIILLIPLSPVGHVLVFGAIQRYAFFYSCGPLQPC